jgi:hypothetical protein
MLICPSAHLGPIPVEEVAAGYGALIPSALVLWNSFRRRNRRRPRRRTRQGDDQ